MEGIIVDYTPTVWCTEHPHPDGPEEGTIWKFYCQYCRRHHIHGGGEGHRAAHCHNRDSPYHEYGYYLVLE